MAYSEASLDAMVELDVGQINPLLIPLYRNVIDAIGVLFTRLVCEDCNDVHMLIQLFPYYSLGSVEWMRCVRVDRDLGYRPPAPETKTWLDTLELRTEVNLN